MFTAYKIVALIVIAAVIAAVMGAIWILNALFDHIPDDE